MDRRLERFRKAQDSGPGSYETALREVRQGRKETHWIWYVFPQLRGLGSSPTSDYYGISGMEEARAYLADPVLGKRLGEISEALMQLEEQDAEKVFGYPDVLKVRSCMTLFAAAAGGGDTVFDRVLEAFYGGDRDSWTLEKLGLVPAAGDP